MRAALAALLGAVLFLAGVAVGVGSDRAPALPAPAVIQLQRSETRQPVETPTPERSVEEVEREVEWDEDGYEYDEDNSGPGSSKSGSGSDNSGSGSSGSGSDDSGSDDDD